MAVIPGSWVTAAASAAAFLVALRVSLNGKRVLERDRMMEEIRELRRQIVVLEVERQKLREQMVEVKHD